jgi:neutral ceramidase
MKMNRRVVSWLVGLIGLAAGGNGVLVADELRAGAAVVEISPRVLPAIKNGGFTEATADRVIDPLQARCLALAAGEQTLVLAIVDSCMIPRDLCDQIKQRVSKQTGVPESHLLVAATHTHSAPSVMDFCLGTRADPNYPPWLVEQVAAGMIAATRELKPAQLGWTVIDAPDQTHCRRWLKHPDHYDFDPFGQRTVRAMMHPGYQNPQYLGPSGPVDTQLSLLSVQSRDGQSLCLLANYSMHYFGADQFSADYFGDFAREVERQLQPVNEQSNSAPFVAMMSQGTSGDLHWMDYSQPQKPNYPREQYAKELADLAIAALPKIEYRSEVTLAAAVTELKLGRRTPDEARLVWARELNAARGENRPRNLPEVYAEQAVWLHEHPDATLLLQVLRIGELGIAAIPNEVFGITGLKLKAQSPLQPLLNMELANGAEGYIPPPEQHRLGGYTTWPARTAGLEVEAEPKIVEALVKLLEEVSGQQRRPLKTDFYNEQQRQAIESAAERR